MKLTTTLFALFFLSALTSLLPSTTADLVLDIEGNPILNGGSYYILPAFSGMGGGIEPAKTGNEICPLTVVQSPNELSDGLPTRISSPYLLLHIPEGFPLDLSFTSPPPCAPTPSKWSIVNAESEGQWSVKLTSYKEDTVKGWFHIEKHGLAYKLTFCSRSNGACSDIGIHIDSEGNRRLVLTTENNPLVVQFKLATSSAA